MGFRAEAFRFSVEGFREKYKAHGLGLLGFSGLVIKCTPVNQLPAVS